jgi:hypothetical protein
LGPVAFWKAWILIQAVTASRPAIMSRGRWPIMLTNRKASKKAMRSRLDQVRNLAERGCRVGPLM